MLVGMVVIVAIVNLADAEIFLCVSMRRCQEYPMMADIQTT